VSLNGSVPSEDVEPAVVEALEHARDPSGAADLLEAVVGEPDDPELALLLQALADHDLVALFEDVERHELARQQHEAQGEEREGLDGLAH
jgi:hypothetical protein